MFVVLQTGGFVSHRLIQADLEIIYDTSCNGT